MGSIFYVREKIHQNQCAVKDSKSSGDRADTVEIKRITRTVCSDLERGVNSSLLLLEIIGMNDVTRIAQLTQIISILKWLDIE